MPLTDPVLDKFVYELCCEVQKSIWLKTLLFFLNLHNTVGNAFPLNSQPGIVTIQIVDSMHAVVYVKDCFN